MSVMNNILDEFAVILFHPIFFSERILSFIFTFIHEMLYVPSSVEYFFHWCIRQNIPMFIHVTQISRWCKIINGVIQY